MAGHASPLGVKRTRVATFSLGPARRNPRADITKAENSNEKLAEEVDEPGSYGEPHPCKERPPKHLLG